MELFISRLSEQERKLLALILLMVTHSITMYIVEELNPQIFVNPIFSVCRNQNYTTNLIEV